MTPDIDGVAVNLAAALNEERRRRREAEAMAEALWVLVRHAARTHHCDQCADALDAEIRGAQS